MASICIFRNRSNYTIVRKVKVHLWLKLNETLFVIVRYMYKINCENLIKLQYFENIFQ